MSVQHSQVEKFALIYAEAVLTYIDSGDAQWVTWDGDHRFDFSSVELDPPELPVLLHVDETWHQLIGELGVSSDPESERYDAEALREAIMHELTEEGLGERALKLFLDQRARFLETSEEDAADEQADRGEPPDS